LSRLYPVKHLFLKLLLTAICRATINIVVNMFINIRAAAQRWPPPLCLWERCWNVTSWL